MAITLYGFDGTMDEAHWSTLLAIHGRGSYDEVVDSGMVASVATGTRVVNVTAGNAVAAGVLAVDDATVQVALAANSSGKSRIDVIVLQIDWSGTSLTGGTITKVQGTPATNPVEPTLTKNPGGLWQVALARMLVRNGVGQMAAGDLTLCKPGPRASKAYADAATHETAGPNSDGTVIATRDIPDPGWPYRLTVSGGAGFSNVAQGNGRIYVNVNGSLLADGRAGRFNEADAVLRTKTTAVLSGESTVVMRMAPSNMSDDLHCTDGDLNVLLLPA